jgi:diguanylate cyclase (GGDEF)-like protein
MSDDNVKQKIVQLEQELKQSRARERALEDLLEKKLNEIYAHYHISRTVGSLLDMQEMLRQVTAIIKKSLPFDRVSIYLVDENREKLELTFSSGLDIQRKVILRMGDGTPGRIAESGEHVHIHDLSTFYDASGDFIHCPDENKHDGSYIGIALKVHNKTIGVIGLDNSVKYGLGVDDMDFMAILSHQIAAGIEKSRLFDKTEHLSQHDGLTGLYNHRMFEEKLRLEIARCTRTNKPVSLIMLDIDHFKQFNDNYGHQAGDQVLKELAVILQKQCRCTSIDVCCRYGGEEFAIIMPELELPPAVNVAERLRTAVEGTSFSIKGKKPGDMVTVSIGVAGMSCSEDMSFEELIKKADEALYLSKRTGRNRVSYSPSASN